MKKVIAFIFGIIGALLLGLIYSWLIILTGSDFNTIMLFFIIPAGAAFLGMPSTFGFYLGLRCFNIKYKHKKNYDFLIGAIALICFISIYFYIYSFTYVSPNYKINYNFIGKHISNFIYRNSNSRINFFTYINHSICSRTSSGCFSIGGTGVGFPIETYNANGVVNWIKFLIQAAGFVLGGICFFGGTHYNSYCDKCEKYLKIKTVASLKLSEFEELFPDESNIDIVKLIETAKNKRKIPFFYLGKHVRIKIIYCPGCNEGTLMLKFMEFVMYKFETMPAKNQDFEIDSSFITELI